GLDLFIDTGAIDASAAERVRRTLENVAAELKLRRRAAEQNWTIAHAADAATPSFPAVISATVSSGPTTVLCCAPIHIGLVCPLVAAMYLQSSALRERYMICRLRENLRGHIRPE